MSSSPTTDVQMLDMKSGLVEKIDVSYVELVSTGTEPCEVLRQSMKYVCVKYDAPLKGC